ncbi:hypothetical protein EUTSA_v10023978mg, partial [Eutrema salsugineum]
TPWSASGSLDLPELVSAPTWAILKDVPPMMYSLDGISCIASAIGEPLHTEKSRLDSINIGETKVKVEIMLDSSPPSEIIVRDLEGNSARVSVTYPRLPPKCSNCCKFGHLLNRCPWPLQRRAASDTGYSKSQLDSQSVVVTPLSSDIEVPPVSADTILDSDHLRQKAASIGLVNNKTKARARSRSRARTSSSEAPSIPNEINTAAQGKTKE